MEEIKPIPPISELRSWLQGRLCSLIEQKPEEVSCDEGFHELGLDSVGYLNLAIAIEEDLDIPITAKEIFLHGSVDELAEFLIRDGEEMRNRSRRLPKGAADYTTVNSGEGLAPLFWLNGYEFLEFAMPHIPEERPVYYLHHQGSDGKPARHRSMEAMADYYIDTIMHVEPEGPYCLGGFSIGGTLAHEIACRLVAMGKQVDLLMLLSPAGHPKPMEEAFYRFHRKHAASLGRFSGRLYMMRQALGLRGRLASEQVEQLKTRMECYRYFWSRRPLPSRLIWPHMRPIYARARRHYEVSPYKGDTILATERTITIEEWTNAVEGSCRVLPRIPLRHLDILKEEHSHLWLKGFIEPLGAPCVSPGAEEGYAGVEGLSGKATAGSPAVSGT